ncbi:hypothetical protein CR513_58827, partial [Mucuna pruriens]
MDAMNSSSENPIPIREEGVNRFKETLEIFDKLFNTLFGVIAFKMTPMGEALFIAHPIVTILVLLMTVLYFLLWLLGTMLLRRIVILQALLVFMMIVIASVVSVLVLSIICSHLAWLSVMSWIGVFYLTAYYCYQVLYNMAAHSISDSINQMIGGNRTHNTRSPV